MTEKEIHFAYSHLLYHDCDMRCRLTHCHLLKLLIYSRLRRIKGFVILLRTRCALCSFALAFCKLLFVENAETHESYKAISLHIRFLPLFFGLYGFAKTITTDCRFNESIECKNKVAIVGRKNRFGFIKAAGEYIFAFLHWLFQLLSSH